MKPYSTNSVQPEPGARHDEFWRTIRNAWLFGYRPAVGRYYTFATIVLFVLPIATEQGALQAGYVLRVSSGQLDVFFSPRNSETANAPKNSRSNSDTLSFDRLDELSRNRPASLGRASRRIPIGDPLAPPFPAPFPDPPVTPNDGAGAGTSLRSSDAGGLVAYILVSCRNNSDELAWWLSSSNDQVYLSELSSRLFRPPRCDGKNSLNFDLTKN